MKFYHLLKLIFFSLLVFSCSSDENPLTDPISEEQTEPEPEEPKSEVYFTLNTFLPPYPVEESEDWVILHDSNGKLLGYKAYKLGDKLQFEAPTDSLSPKISVAYFRYTESDGNKFHRISITPNVDKGYIESFGPYSLPENVEYAKTGEFDVIINNIPNPDRVAYPVKVEISSGRGRLSGASGGIGYPNGIELTFERVEKYEDFDDYLISILDGNNNLKYHFLENTEGMDFAIDYIVDFLDFEKDISISLPQNNSYNLNIAGFKEDQEFSQYGGYWLHDVISVINKDVITTPLKIGYLDIFSKYRTQFNINMNEYNYSIVKYGDALEELIVPEKPVVSIINPSRKTFRFEVDIDFLSAGHSWTYQEGSFENNDHSTTAWGFNAEKGFDPSIGDLPNEILEKYPTLHMEALEYGSSRFSLPLPNAKFLSSHTVTVFSE